MTQEKERYVGRRMEECTKLVEQMSYAKVETDRRVKLLERIIKAKDSEISNIKTLEDALEHEVRNLRDILRNEVLAS